MAEENVFDIDVNRHRKFERRQNRTSFNFFEQAYVDAYIGDINSTREALKAQGIALSKAKCEKLHAREDIQDAIQERGDNPMLSELILSNEAIKVFLTQGVLNLTDPKLQLDYIKTLGKAQGAFVEEHKLTVNSHEDFLKSVLGGLPVPDAIDITDEAALLTETDDEFALE